MTNQETLDNNKTIAKKSIELFQKGNAIEIEKIIDPSYKLHFPGQPKPMSLKETMKMNEEYYKAFPKTKVTVDFQVAEGDKVVSHITYEGVHSGEFQGIPASNNTVKTSGVAIQTIKNGRVVEEWNEFDTASMLQQMGAMPEMGKMK
jgi:steroid delta-isomerase-like uncharacterized protein